MPETSSLLALRQDLKVARGLGDWVMGKIKDEGMVAETSRSPILAPDPRSLRHPSSSTLYSPSSTPLAHRTRAPQLLLKSLI